MTTILPPPNRSPIEPIDWSSSLAEHERWLRGVIFARTGEAQAVDEVWQEVALAAIEQRSPLADRSKAPQWLYRLAVVLSIRHRRRQARGRKRLTKLAAESNPRLSERDDPADWLLRKERRQLVRRALESLPGRDAEILLLKYHERWSYRQIAAVLEISESAVDARVFRARQRLRQSLSSYFSNEDLP